MSGSHHSGSGVLQGALGAAPITLPTLPIRFRRPQLLECVDGCLVVVASDEDQGGRPVTLKGIPKELLREDQEALSREVMNLHAISRWDRGPAPRRVQPCTLHAGAARAAAAARTWPCGAPACAHGHTPAPCHSLPLPVTLALYAVSAALQIRAPRHHHAAGCAAHA
jgi:hypothetical protein